MSATGGDVCAASAEFSDAIRSGDKPAVERLLDPAFTLIDSSGRLFPRTNASDALSAAQIGPEASVSHHDYGTIALVVRRDTSPQQGELVGVEVWIRDSEAWRALISHQNVVADAGSPSTHPPLTRRPPEAPPPPCDNPLISIPYQPKSEAERDLIASFKALETAVTQNDPETWVAYVADEFVVYRTKQHQTTKAGRAKMLSDQREVNNETFVAEIGWMELWVHGDAAVMRADHVMPGNRRPPYRATRIWVKRGGVWQMAVSQQTTRVK